MGGMCLGEFCLAPLISPPAIPASASTHFELAIGTGVAVLFAMPPSITSTSPTRRPRISGILCRGLVSAICSPTHHDGSNSARNLLMGADHARWRLMLGFYGGNTIGRRLWLHRRRLSPANDI